MNIFRFEGQGQCRNLNVEKLSLLHVLEHYLDGQMKESKKKASICNKNNTSVKKHNQINENIQM